MLLCLCGEIQPPVTFSGCYLGSSPLTRGIQSPMGMFPAYARFTPAHAGNTRSMISQKHSSKVHPRSRGEYIARRRNNGDWVGSPPLTRGILRLIYFKFIVRRFTPAHAGNTGSHPLPFLPSFFLLSALPQNWPVPPLSLLLMVCVRSWSFPPDPKNVLLGCFCAWSYTKITGQTIPILIHKIDTNKVIKPGI